MKKKTLAAALLSALLLASCANDSSSKTNDSKSVDSSDTVSSSADTSSVTDNNSNESTEESNDDQSGTDSEDQKSDASEKYKERLKTVDSSSEFTQASGDPITFGELLEQGYANVVEDGKGYCLVKSGGGAGNIFYSIFCTEDGGKTWVDDGAVSVFIGALQCFPLEDGRLMLFDRITASNTSNPYVYQFRYEKNSVIMETDLRYFDGLVLDDGTKLAPDSHVDVQGKYLGGNKIHLTVTGDDGKVLFDHDAAFDSVDLGLIKSDAAR